MAHKKTQPSTNENSPIKGKDQKLFTNFQRLLRSGSTFNKDYTTIDTKKLNYLIPGLGDAWEAASAPIDSHNLEKRLKWDQINECNIKETIDNLQSKREFYAESHCKDRKGERIKEIPFDKIYRANNIRKNQKSTFGDENIPFVDIWEPLSEYYTNEVRKHLKKTEVNINLSPKVYTSLGAALCTKLSEISIHALYEEFISKRTAGQLLTASVLCKNSSQKIPNEFYKNFVNELKEDRLRQFFKIFPVLEQHITRTVDLSLKYSLEIISRLSNDQEFISRSFNYASSTFTVEDIILNQGDLHNGGKTVAILKLKTKKGAKKLVYKPRSLAIDESYNKFIQQCNNFSNYKIMHLRVLNMGTYGYAEYIEHKVCSDKNQLKYFYRNAGRITAILYILGCTDCHHENLIATEKDLILIDCETLLEPELANEGYSIKYAPNRNREQIINTQFRQNYDESVVRTGLLPNWHYIGKERIPIDVSAFGISPPVNKTLSTIGLGNINTDAMTYKTIERTAEIATSLPVSYGEKNPFSEYLDEFVSGFQQQLINIQAIKAKLTQKNGVIDSFSQATRRIVLRDTYIYKSIFNEMIQPAALSSFLYQGLIVEKLSRSFLVYEDKPKNWPIFHEESEHLHNLDIPYFEHKVGFKDLKLKMINQNINSFVEDDGINACKRRLNNLDQKIIDFQIMIIKGCAKARIDLKSTSTDKNVEHKSAIDSEKLIQISKDQLIFLQEMMIGSCQENPEWLGLVFGPDEKHFSFGPIGLSLYSGSIGISILAALVNNNGEHNVLIDKILKPLQKIAENSFNCTRWWYENPLGLTGCGGIMQSLLTLKEIGYSSNQIDIDELIYDLVSCLSVEIIQGDCMLDIIGGVSGLVGSIIQIDNNHKESLLDQAGLKLAESQNKDGSWTLPSSMGKKSLIGFSHGSSGISAALAKLGQYCNSQKYLDSAKAGIDWESKYFNLSKLNWPDLRLTQVAPFDYSMNWCHGAPGVALSRACLRETNLWNQKYETEMHLALQATSQNKQLDNHHLCCGSMGTVTILNTLSRDEWLPSSYSTLQKSLVENSHILVNATLEKYKSNNNFFTCYGTKNHSLQLPGFMTGISGICIALLDVANQNNISLNLMSAGLLTQKSNSKH
ncbi:type 2 lanthipeptide synthetase LanM [Synechococcus sp. MIT S1220]|uniref:type 2 lanthipeptide synthetase LanM n=1 Tax=Synechococcus sp. MIT S1220 TaxID=3082549 RepID=UPI0039AEA6DF